MANISQQKRQKMLDFLNKLKQEHQDDDSLRALGEIETALNEKKYGLVWEKHTEKVDEMLEHNIPVFCEDESKKIVANENDGYNFLLEGDNLHSLKLLEKTHKGKIDIIYIDPPYNTGNKDFIYNDSFVDKADGYSHSKWLSFMSERLEIARELLSDEGVIFISIDDNEQAQLKLLCDEIFGEENFINNINLKTKNAAGASGGGEDKRLKKNIEYLLVYTKKIIFFEPFNTVYNNTKITDLLKYYEENNVSWKYTSVLVDRGEKEYLCSTYDGSGEEIKIYKRNNFKFSSINSLCKEENLSLEDVYNKYYYDIHMTAMPQSSIRGRVIDAIGNENFDKSSLYSIEYIPKSGKNKGTIYEQFYKGEKARLIAWFSDVGVKNEYGVFKKDIEGTLWTGIEWNNLNKEGSVKFDNGKKPISLIIRILKMKDKTATTILDFFAGSGTTGHAVMQLNKEDGGNRKYILCTNNENNICEEVTYQRLKNIQDELPHNLKYFKTDFISKYESDEDEETISEKMLEHIKELIELEHHIEIDNEKYIILDDEDELEKTIENIKEGGKLFITSGIFLSRTHQRILDEKHITVVDIPEYYYRSELKEVGEL